jgi:gamma-glutamylputrescine oxidase
VLEADALIRRRVERYGIDCSLSEGNLFTALTPSQMRELEHRDSVWRRFWFDRFRLLDRASVPSYVGSEAYLGGMADPTGGHVHPLNLALGEAAALEALGGTIHEGSAVIGVEGTAGRPTLRTSAGIVRPQVLILAGNAYLGYLVPALEDRIMPFSTQILATEPLGERAAALIPSGYCVEDERFIQDYYRMSKDGRLLFGGGAVFGGSDPANIRRKLLPGIARVFPQLDGVRIDFVWSGNCAISFNRVPQIGQLGPATYFAQGYSGHGIIGSHLFGQLLGEAAAGERERFDVFARVPWARFPGGRRLAAPYTLLGSWWYGLRDRFDL